MLPTPDSPVYSLPCDLAGLAAALPPRRQSVGLVLGLWLALEWESGLIQCARWVDAPAEGADLLTQHLIALSLHAPGALESWLAPAATPFAQRLRHELFRIMPGHTVSYGAMATRLGGRAARGVGMALGANPIPWFVPCHRVIAADGSLGGYSAGIENKRLLLLRERCWAKANA